MISVYSTLRDCTPGLTKAEAESTGTLSAAGCSGRILYFVFLYWLSVHITQFLPEGFYRIHISLYLLYKKLCNFKWRFISSSVSSINSILWKCVKKQTSQVTGWKLHVISKRRNLRNMLLFYQCLFIDVISHRIITMNVLLELWGVKGFWRDFFMPMNSWHEKR